MRWPAIARFVRKFGIYLLGIITHEVREKPKGSALPQKTLWASYENPDCRTADEKRRNAPRVSVALLRAVGVGWSPLRRHEPAFLSLVLCGVFPSNNLLPSSSLPFWGCLFQYVLLLAYN